MSKTETLSPKMMAAIMAAFERGLVTGAYGFWSTQRTAKAVAGRGLCEIRDGYSVLSRKGFDLALATYRANGGTLTVTFYGEKFQAE